MNFLFAVIIGVVIGGIGGFVLRSKMANAIWLAPVLSVVGALIAATAAAIFGDKRDYGPKEITLQIVLAIVGVAVTWFLGNRAPAKSDTPVA